MNIYLLRHGDAEESTVDPQNPLSELGKRKVKRLGAFLSPLAIQVSYVFHSGKLRAKQTAEIMAKEIHYPGALQLLPGFEPQDLVSPIASDINQMDQDALLVGHMPFMSKLAAKLVTGNESEELIVFQTATLVCLARVGGSHWLIKWVLSPELWGQDVC